MSIPASSFIVTSFQLFYEEVLRLKERALRESDDHDVEDDIADLANENEEDQDQDTDGASDNAVLAANDAVADAKDISFQNIQRKLRIYLEEQSLKASYQLGDLAQANFKEAYYIMAAMADEVFLNFNWPGRIKWRKNLLESQLFQSQSAGDLLFQRLDALLEVADPARVDLAVVYLQAISLGFRGKYRDQNSDEKISYYKKQLFNFVNRKDSDLYTPGRLRLLNAPYEHNVTLPPTKGLPDIRTWVMIFSGVALTYLFVTYVLWYRVVSDLNEALEYILEQARSMPL